MGTALEAHMGCQIEDTTGMSAIESGQIDELIYLCFNMLLVIELFRWMLRLFRLCKNSSFTTSLAAVCCVFHHLASHGVKILIGSGQNHTYQKHIHCPPKVWKHPWQSVVLDDISINPYHFLVQIH